MYTYCHICIAPWLASGTSEYDVMVTDTALRIMRSVHVCMYVCMPVCLYVLNDTGCSIIQCSFL